MRHENVSLLIPRIFLMKSEANSLGKSKDGEGDGV